MKIQSRYLVTIAALLILSTSVFANTILVTPDGATNAGGGPVSATAEFAFSAGQLILTLTNTLVNPKDVAQNISDFSFLLANDVNTTGSALTNSSGLERTVASNGSFTNGSTVATGWALSTPIIHTVYLNVLGTAAGPGHTIIGLPNASNLYSNANGSIAGNGPHNPFLAGPVQFIISIPGVTAATVPVSAVFSFGTTPGNNVPTTAPEPTSLLLLGSGLGMIGLAAWRKKK